MDRTRHTIITVTIAVAIAAILAIAGLSSGQSLMIGAFGGIIASIYIQRKTRSQSSLPGDALDESDLESVRQNAASIVLDVRADVARIDNAAVDQLVGRIADQFEAISRRLPSLDQASVAPIVVDDLFEPAQALVTEYLWLQQREGIAEQDRMATLANRDLPAAEFAARQVAALIERTGKIDVEQIRRTSDFSQDHDESLPGTNPDTWGNRQKLVDDAERLN